MLPNSFIGIVRLVFGVMFFGLKTLTFMIANILLLLYCMQGCSEDFFFEEVSKNSIELPEQGVWGPLKNFEYFGSLKLNRLLHLM